ncbi:MAG: FkbM family methyltransferase [Candidatus Binatia bacterium]
MDQIIELHELDFVDIVKIDIERAEIEVFAGDCGPWLRKTRNIAIELHDDECAHTFFRALRCFTFRTSRRDDVWVLCDVAAAVKEEVVGGV